MRRIKQFMKTTLFSLVILILTTLSCATTSDGQTSTNGKNLPKSASDVTTRPLLKPRGETPLHCVKSINQFGQPGNCQCQSELSYNPITGRCEKGGRMCTQALVEMFNEATGQCHTARNGCEAGDLKSIGWRQRKPEDSCKH